jgi:Secretion system C-terminal sorting domain
MKQFFHFKTLWLALFVAAFFAAPQSAHATHALGADLSYTHLTGNTYRFTLVFYRDCAGIAAPATFPASVNGCGNATQTFTLTQVGLGTEITPVCATQTSTCSGGTVFGVQRYVYEGVFTFASQCANWKVSTAHCCRNVAISTIANPGNFEIYVQAIVNNTIINNAPVFTQTPALYACANQPFIYNNVVIDTDGDSLSYALTNPLDGPAPGTSISYATGFSALEPLTVTAAGFGFNNITGQMSFTPTVVGEVSVLAFLVKEYRNGVFIGSVMRDVQIIVLNCAANNAPTLGNITNVTGATFVASSGSGTFNTCPGQAMSFSISANDVDAAQTITMLTNINAAFPGATATVVNAGTNAATLTFTWTPTNEDAGTYLFRVETRDDHCPTYGSAVKGFIIKVRGVRGRSFIQTLCKGTPTVIDLTAQAYEVPNGQYQWTAVPSVGTLPNTQTVTATIAQSTTFTVKYQDNICNATDTVIVRAYGGVAAMPATVNGYCPSSAPIALAATYANPAPTVPPTNTVTYAWAVSPAAAGAVSNATIPTPTATVANAANGTTIRYIVTATDGRCTSKDTVVVNAACVACFNVATIRTPNTAILTCTRTSVALTAASPGSNGALTYLWSNAATTATINATATGIYTVTVTNTQTNGSTCTSTASVAVTQNNVAPTVTINSANVLTCTQPTAVLTANVAANTTFVWSSGAPTVTAPGIYTVTATRTGNGCTATASIAVTQDIAIPIITLTKSNNLTCALLTATLNATSIPNSVFTWASGAPTVTAAGTYTVTATNISNGCVATASIAVTQNITPPVITLTKNHDLNCTFTTALLSATSSANTTFVWSSGAPTVTAPGVYTVTATRTGNGCTATASIAVTQNTTTPTFSLNKNHDIDCSFATSILSTNAIIPANTFRWSNAATAPTITVTTAGIYTVTVTNTISNCTASRTIAVTQNTIAPVVTAAAANMLDCAHSSALLTATANILSPTYRWSNGTPTQTTTVTTPNTYRVTVTNPVNNCSATASVVVTRNTVSAVATITGNTALDCAITNTTLAASANVGLNPTYLWSNGDITPTTLVDNAGIYGVTITSASTGCTAIGSVTVTENAVAPVVTISGITSFCSNRSTTLIATTGSTASTFVWNNGNTAAANTVITAATHTVTATNPTNHCTASKQITTTTRPAPVAAITQLAVVCPGIPTALIASGGGTYLWNNATTNPVLTLQTPTIATIYTVTVTGTNACTAVADITVQALTGTICVGNDNPTDNTAGITLYPNPTTAQFSIVFGSAKWLNTTITVTDIAGRTLTTLQKSIITPNETLNIATDDWATGVYFVTISNASDKKVLKVVKVMEK